MEIVLLWMTYILSVDDSEIIPLVTPSINTYGIWYTGFFTSSKAPSEITAVSMVYMIVWLSKYQILRTHGFSKTGIIYFTG